MDYNKGAKLKLIRDKVFEHERLDIDDGLYILESNEILLLGQLADKVRKERAGDYVSFVNNYHICFTNICKNKCHHCQFRRDKSDGDAFLLSMDEIIEKAKEAKELAVPEVLLMGGIHPTLDFGFYVNALRSIKNIIPEVKILAFSAVEIKNFVKISGKSVKEVLETLQDAGLTAFTGGGMDILKDSFAKKLKVDPDRMTTNDWMEIHITAHKLSIATNACMIYGAGESSLDIVKNLDRLRTIQDKTCGFTHFFPYGYGEDGKKMTDGMFDLKMLLLARLFLDNFSHIRVYWGYVGKRLAQISLSFGVDDLNGVRQKGRIIHTTGNIQPSFSSEEEMKRIICSAGKIPVERDILFSKVRIFD